MTQRSMLSGPIIAKTASILPKESSHVPSKYELGNSYGKLGQTQSKGSMQSRVLMTFNGNGAKLHNFITIQSFKSIKLKVTVLIAHYYEEALNFVLKTKHIRSKVEIPNLSFISCPSQLRELSFWGRILYSFLPALKQVIAVISFLLETKSA